MDSMPSLLFRTTPLHLQKKKIHLREIICKYRNLSQNMHSEEVPTKKKRARSLRKHLSEKICQTTPGLTLTNHAAAKFGRSRQLRIAFPSPLPVVRAGKLPRKLCKMLTALLPCQICSFVTNCVASCVNFTRRIVFCCRI
jgi:hypothetical protein